MRTLKMCVWHGRALPVHNSKGEIVGYVCPECRDPYSGGMVIKK